MNDFTSIIIRIIILVIIFSIFYYLSNNYIETFKSQDEEYKAFNTRLNYRNSGELPWERHEIYASLPQDVTIKYTDAYFYEYGNEEYELKLREIFNNNCKQIIMAVEGTNWNDWVYPKKSKNPDIILTYYNNIYNYIYEKINKSSILRLPNDPNNKIQIVHDILTRYRQNKNNPDYYLFDIEFLLYREGKMYGKHIRFVVMSNTVDINVIIIKLKGIVSEDNMIMHPVLANDENSDLNKDYDIFIPQKNLEYIKIKEADKNNAVYSSSEKLSESAIENQLYKKILNNYNTEDSDDYNNNYHPQDDIAAREKETLEDSAGSLERNITYTIAQNNMRKQFLANLQKPVDETKNSNNIYKNFPYENDIDIAKYDKDSHATR